jgi:crotonyl-CoA reductase
MAMNQEAAMKEILHTILDPSSQPGDFATLPLPDAYRAVTLQRAEEHMFDGLDPRDRNLRKSLHIEEVPVPELGLGEALIAVMASSANYNTVWSSIFSPGP